MGEVQPDFQKFMSQAIDLAKQAKGKTAPNPTVGAVVVSSDGEIIGSGFHPKAGLPHAEVFAIKDALTKTNDLSKCTLYVTLEPCGHFGKTPPCVDLIIENKIKEVVIGSIDPHPLMQGKSLAKLKDHGVNVTEGILTKECDKLIRGFKSVLLNERPFVTLKCAASLDGKISTVTGESKWITSEEARQYAHDLRAAHDAILVGVGTIVSDNPRLDARLGNKTKALTKVILDTRLTTPVTSQIFSTEGDVIIYCDENYSQKRKTDLELVGAKIVPLSLFENRVDIAHALNDLRKKGIQELMVEGGSQVLQSFIRLQLFDEIKYFVAPKIISNQPELSQSLMIQNMSVKKIGPDFIFEGTR